MTAGRLYQFTLPPAAAARRGAVIDSLSNYIVKTEGDAIVLDFAGSTAPLFIRMLSAIGTISDYIAPVSPSRVWEPPARGGYHDYNLLKADIATLPNDFGNLVECRSLGSSYEQRDILAFFVKPTKPLTRRILLVGCHHGCERISVEVPYRAGVKFAESRRGGLDMGGLDGIELVVIPMLNPDGHEFFTSASATLGSSRSAAIRQNTFALLRSSGRA